MNQRFRRISPGVLCLALAGFARAQDLPAFDKKLAAAGKELFRTHCATCHGPAGKGDGPSAANLHVVPPDLSRLGQRSRDGFSFDKIRRIIDGRDPVKGHGGPEMPVWGDALKTPEAGYSEREAAKKITSLANYLASIQER
jgi:mono/diheme cytochrome c family protein